jgi:hypothetical protein
MSLQQIADAAKRVDALQKNLHGAEEYIAKIGQPQPHYRDGSVGALHSLEITTQIHHQASSGSTNYWNCAAFDIALAAVIKSHFPDLAREALARMTQAYHSALIAEKDHLKGALEEVERAEELAATNNPFSEVNQKGCNPAHADA